ncbi:MAG: hypothetical protein HYR85_19180 [Planctomycetes bacterium]|nr:hypothetical protein [Planctomycetota bacterium]
MRTQSFVALTFVALASTTLASTRLVPQDFPTIQAAVDASSPDDFVLVAPGTYAESIRIDGLDRLTIGVQNALGGPVVLDVRAFDAGIVAHDLDGLVIRGLTILQDPAPSSFAAIVLDEPGAFGGGPAPLSRIVIRYVHIVASNRGVAILGGTDHVVVHCSTIEVGGEYGVGWDRGSRMRVKFSEIRALPGTAPQFGVLGRGNCPALPFGPPSVLDRVLDTRIEGAFRVGIGVAGVSDLHAIHDTIRLAGPHHPSGEGTTGILIQGGCTAPSDSSNVEVRTNDVENALVGLELSGVEDSIVIGNSLGRNGSSSSPFGSAIAIDPQSGAGASCGLRIVSNNFQGLHSPRSQPAVRVNPATHCSSENANGIDHTNAVDLGRALLGS